mmetsp:Transcript_62146/g.115304  ORF Transcript_62146/g.115304 Transcript_62146/m.115304 type:complete len:344 (-) Transcript_62146:208-1239(-)
MLPVPQDVNAEADVNDEATVATADHQLREELRDALDTRGVASVLMANWSQSEKEACVGMSKLVTRPDFNCSHRKQVFQFYHNLINGLQLGIDCWYMAVWMLLRTLAAAPQLEASPVTYVAVVLLLQKNTSAMVPVLIDLYVAKAKELTIAQAKDAGLANGAAMAKGIQARDVLSREKQILEALGWKINLPSVHTWLSTISTRMDVLFKQSFGPQIEVAFGSALQWCNALMLLTDTAICIPPRQLACSLFCIGLAYTGVIPIDTILQGEAAQHEKTFSKAWGVSHPPACLVPHHQVAQIVQVVEVAICRSMTQLLQDIGAVAPVLQEFMHERDMQLHRAHLGGA